MKYYISLFFIGMLLQGYAQDTLTIAKATVVQQVTTQNLQHQIAEKDITIAQADYRQTNSVFLPSVSVSHTALYTTNPLMAFGSKLNQEILTANDFNPALLNDPDAIENYATKIEVLQPIINMDGFYGRAAAKASLNAYELQSDRTVEYLQFEAEKTYMQLQLTYKAVAVLQKAYATATANLQLVTNYQAQGLVKQTDVLSVQVRVNEVKNQLQTAKSNVKNVSDYLKFLMGETKEGIYQPEDELNDLTEMFTPESELPANRKDILAMEQAEDARKKMMQSGNMVLLPRLNAFGSYELYDDQVFQMGAKGYTVGVSLSWDIFDGYKSLAKSGKAKAEYQKSVLETEQYKAQSQLELNKVNRQLQDAENNVHLAKEIVDQSTENYRILHNRFEQGLEKTTDVLNAETLKFQKELALLQAVFEYNSTKAYLQFLTK